MKYRIEFEADNEFTCLDCPARGKPDDLRFDPYVCQATWDFLPGFPTRPEWCPLKEVAENGKG